MSPQNKNRIYNLIQDQQFIDWVLDPTTELNEYWNDYQLRHPGIEDDILEAKVLIKGIAKKTKKLSDHDVEKLWKRIDHSVSAGQRTIRFSRWAVAASIIVMVGLAGGIGYFFFNQHPEVDYSSIARLEPASNGVTLFLADSTKEIFSSNHVEIEYDENGNISTGDGRLLAKKEREKSDQKEQFNQLVVPFGKHSDITLSDGTRLWLNSGSRAIYPVAFNKKVREIFIEGEAYLEVAHNEKKPFFVKTKDLKVRVLGTKFNVSAYPEDQVASVVLVEGKVEACFGKDEAVMKPNQIFSVEKRTGKTAVDVVDAREYIAWKEGWLLCNSEKMSSIIAKLSRYYDVHILVRDSGVNHLSLTGKLDLKNDCSSVLEAIASTAPIIYTIKDSTHIVVSMR